MAELASFSETSRQRALERFELLRAHIEDGRPLAAIARETRLSYRMLQYWLERYRTSGLAALARKPRTDRGCRRKLSAALQEAIEGLALQKPPLPISVLCNRAQLLAESLGEEPPSCQGSTVGSPFRRREYSAHGDAERKGATIQCAEAAGATLWGALGCFMWIAQGVAAT